MLRLLRVALAGLALGLCAGAATAQPPLEAYGRLPSFTQMTLSPAGDRYAAEALVDGKRRVVVMEGGRTLASIETGAAKVRSIDWAGEDRVLVTTSKSYALDPSYWVRARAEIAQIVVLNFKAHAVSGLMQHGEQGNGVHGFYGARQRGGRWFAYLGALTVTHTFGGDAVLKSSNPDLFEVDLDSGARRRAATAAVEGHDRDWLIGPDGAVLATEDYGEKEGEWKLWVGEPSKTPVATAKFPVRSWIVGAGRTAGSVVYGQKQAQGDIAWFEVSGDGKAASPLFTGRTPLSPIRDPASGLLLGATVEGEALPQLFDPIRQRHVRSALKALGERNAVLEALNGDCTKLLIFTSGTGDSGTYWLVDIAAKSATPVGAAYLDVPAEAVGAISMVDYKAADGLVLQGVLTLPPGRDPKGLPLVVMPHGGPRAHDNPVFDWWAQAFASRGYAVFQPNFRGSDGAGEALYMAGRNEWGRKMQTDVSDGVAELARRGVIDAKRACVVGASYGGYVALAGVTLQHGLYRCAVSYGGVSDLGDFAAYQITKNATETNDDARYWDGYIGKGRTLHDLSPKAHAVDADAPILLIHGKDDTVVPLDQSQGMAAALRRAGKPVDIVMLDGEDHWLSAEASRQALVQVSVAFVEKNNPPR